MTHCNPPRAPMALAARAPGAWDGAWDGARVVHGVWGARVEAAVRLMLELRARAEAAGDAGGAKVVVFSRFEQTLSLLARACAMHAIRTASSGGARGTSGLINRLLPVSTNQYLRRLRASTTQIHT